MVYGSPRFSTRENEYRGNPVIEILKDNEPFWDDMPGHKSRFCFGLQKAELILSCLDVISEFADRQGYLPQYFSPTWEKSLFETDCCIHVVTTFKKSSGNIIEKPVLELSNGFIIIKFGLLKAEALLEVQKELQKFLEKYSSQS